MGSKNRIIRNAHTKQALRYGYELDGFILLTTSLISMEIGELLTDQFAKLLPVPVRERIIGEVKINYLHAYHENDEILSKLRMPSFLPMYKDGTVLELKQKISGLTTIPIPKLRLIFCGEILKNDDENIPRDAFELNENVAEDDDIFRPRIQVSVQHVHSDLDDQLGSDKKPEEGADAELEFRMRMLRMAEAGDDDQSPRLDGDIQDDDGNVDDNIDVQLFDLRIDLEKIQCGKYFDVLRDSGYGNEGSFSCLTDADLRTDSLWIPRKARNRILALADAIKRRLAILDKDKSRSLNSKIQKQMLDSKVMNTMTLEGQSGHFETKADMRSAWARKVKEDERIRKELLEASKHKEPPPKPHSKELQEKIDKIRWKAEKDEFGMPINVKIYPPRNFCCEKHEYEASEARKSYLEMRYNANIVEIRNILQQVSKANNDFLSREALKVIAELQIKKNGHALPGEQLESLLDKCIMSDVNQLRRQEWANERERRENLGAIPVALYDGHKYLSDLAAILKDLDSKLI